MRKKHAGFTLIELLIVIAIIGILAAIAIPNLLNAIQRGRQKRTMADIKALASAIESYHVDASVYPSAACAAGIFTDLGPALATNSFTNLSPTYIARPLVTDGWGHFLMYNIDSAQAYYNVISLGRDGVASAAVCGTTTDFNQDIIFSNGSFLQWPEGTQY